MSASDEQIRDYERTLPTGHYARQWCIDAVAISSASHPHRRANARRELAKLMSDCLTPSV